MLQLAVPLLTSFIQTERIAIALFVRCQAARCSCDPCTGNCCAALEDKRFWNARYSSKACEPSHSTDLRWSSHHDHCQGGHCAVLRVKLSLVTQSGTHCMLNYRALSSQGGLYEQISDVHKRARLCKLCAWNGASDDHSDWVTIFAFILVRWSFMTPWT